MNGFKPPTCSTKRSARGAHLSFCILTVVGDVLDDGELRFVETAQTFEAARRRIDALARVWPRQYESTIEKRENASSLPQSPHKKRSYRNMGSEPEPTILCLEKPFMLLHPIAVALVVGTIAVPLCGYCTPRHWDSGAVGQAVAP